MPNQNARMDPLKPFPPLSPDLIEALAERFPNRCPTLKNTDREVWWNAGAASVVEWLHLEHQRQQEGDKEP